MKKIFFPLLCAFLLFLLPNNSNAQTAGIPFVNKQLRTLFGNLSLPPNPKLFLYDMSCHMTDSTFFTSQCTDTINSPIWFKVYEEMYHSAYDTMAFKIPDSLYYEANRFYSDTIPFGIMNYGFYKLKPKALTSSLYFDFDTTNNRIYDKFPRPSYPYIDSNLFAASPLLEESYFSDPVFRIDPAFMLYDHHNADNFENDLRLKVDFGDGRGWVIINLHRISHHSVNYASSGNKYIQTIVENAVTNKTIRSSRSMIRVLNSGQKPVPTAVIKTPGLNVAVFGGCNSNIKSGKLVIYVSGFDLLDFLPALNRGPERIYHEMISENKVVQLKNQGYSFVVVDYKNSRVDMRFNALYLVNLIEKLKCGLDMEHQFVIMGESMGGLVARFAMTYMESIDYDNQSTAPFFIDAGSKNSQDYLIDNPHIINLPSQWCLTPKKHNTRLLITLDSPHQGANVPLSLQSAYNGVLRFISNVLGMEIKSYTQAHNLFLDGMAAKQMLIYYGEEKIGSTYKSSPFKDSFFNQLQIYGDYPKYAKTTALSNGSLAGESQTNHSNHQPRPASDRLIDLDLDIYARVLGRKFTMFDAELEAYTNPNGYGKILDAYAGIFSISLKLYWIGIKFEIGKKTILDEVEYATALPYCTSPGGYTGDPMPLGYKASASSTNHRYEWMRYLFNQKMINNGNGCFYSNGHIGINGILSGNYDFSMCSNGFHFTLVPVQSALDYATLGTSPLNQDIENEAIVSKLNKVKPDVIIGYPESGPYANKLHTRKGKNSFRNIGIYNLTQTKAPNKDYTYYSCINYNDHVERGLINLEIGDEELYLENAELPWQSLYQAEYDIHVNKRNPYFQYPSSPTSPLAVLGAYSKEDSYVISSTGWATFIVDKNSSPTRVGLNYLSPHTGTYSKIEEPLQICCVNFIGARAEEVKKQKPEKTQSNSFTVFPNPNKGNAIFINYTQNSSNEIRVEITNYMGKLFASQSLKSGKAGLETTSRLSLKSTLPNGMYIVRLISDNDVLSQLVMVSNK